MDPATVTLGHVVRELREVHKSLFTVTRVSVDPVNPREKTADLRKRTEKAGRSSVYRLTKAGSGTATCVVAVCRSETLKGDGTAECV